MDATIQHKMVLNQITTTSSPYANPLQHNTYLITMHSAIKQALAKTSHETQIQVVLNRAMLSC